MRGMEPVSGTHLCPTSPASFCAAVYRKRLCHYRLRFSDHRFTPLLIPHHARSKLALRVASLPSEDSR